VLALHTNAFCETLVRLSSLLFYHRRQRKPFRTSACLRYSWLQNHTHCVVCALIRFLSTRKEASSGCQETDIVTWSSPHTMSMIDQLAVCARLNGKRKTYLLLLCGSNLRAVCFPIISQTTPKCFLLPASSRQPKLR